MTQKVYVVGLGPGGIEQMTQRAKAALASCDVIAGYHVYIDLIKEDFADKEFLTTGMRKEVDRCKLAIEEALKGKTVAMISSGDAGVYGMAGIMYQVAAEHPELEIEVVPGITAACSGAAVLGAPLISDFCLISLSDLLTPLLHQADNALILGSSSESSVLMRENKHFYACNIAYPVQDELLLAAVPFAGIRGAGHMLQRLWNLKIRSHLLY